MSLDYDLWFASPPPSISLLLTQVEEDYMNVDFAHDEEYLFYFERKSANEFDLYYSGKDMLHGKEDTRLLTINPDTTVDVGNHVFPEGPLGATECWYMSMGKGNINKANEAYTLLLRAILQHYTGDFAFLFEYSPYLYRLAGQVYISQDCGLADEPLLSLLKVANYSTVTTTEVT